MAVRRVGAQRPRNRNFRREFYGYQPTVTPSRSSSEPDYEASREERPPQPRRESPDWLNTGPGRAILFGVIIVLGVTVLFWIRDLAELAGITWAGGG